MENQEFDFVFVGDLIDRGENSAQVLDTVYSMDSRSDVTCLMGNHERMMLDFLSDPARYGARWMRNGGLQTLASFGVGGVTDTSSEHALSSARHKLSEKLGPMHSWLHNLPLQFQSGNIFVAHAGANPAKPVTEQNPQALLWGSSRFFGAPRQDGIWVAHGHYVFDTPETKDGRISVDTGAYATGVLTAAVIKDGDISFFSVKR